MSGYSSSRAAPSDYSSSRSSSGYSSSRASSYYGSHRGDSSHHHRGDRTNHRGDSYHQPPTQPTGTRCSRSFKAAAPSGGSLVPGRPARGAARRQLRHRAAGAACGSPCCRLDCAIPKNSTAGRRECAGGRGRGCADEKNT